MLYVFYWFCVCLGYQKQIESFQRSSLGKHWLRIDIKWCDLGLLSSLMFFFLMMSLGTGLAAVLINISVENFAGWKYSLTFKIIQTSYVAGFIVYTMINLALVFSSVYIITQFAPAAAGSGIPEIKGYLNGKPLHLMYVFLICVISWLMDHLFI